MQIGIIKETDQFESRVAVVPAHIKQLLNAGYKVAVEKDAGKRAGYSDDTYTKQGAVIAKSREALVKESDILLSVTVLNASEKDTLSDHLKENQILIGMVEPYETSESFEKAKANKATVLSMELIPRTTRAQSMDVLSSMANLAGYKSVLIGAEQSPKMFPMMMTAAGTIVPANVFILGVGVAGLQAIATAKRLGAVTHAYDVRSEVKEQVLSLGAKFVEYDLEKADGEGGYAKAMDKAFYEKQQALMEETLSTMDVVITTANIPGKKAPILITEKQVKAMQPGSVIVDLAAERGGNCALTEVGKTVVKHGVKIIGPKNIPGTLAFNASALYSKNIITFLDNLLDKESKALRLDDDIVKATLITHAGEFSARYSDIIGGKK